MNKNRVLDKFLELFVAGENAVQSAVNAVAFALMRDLRISKALMRYTLWTAMILFLGTWSVCEWQINGHMLSWKVLVSLSILPLYFLAQMMTYRVDCVSDGPAMRPPAATGMMKGFGYYLLIKACVKLYVAASAMPPVNERFRHLGLIQASVDVGFSVLWLLSIYLDQTPRPPTKRERRRVLVPAPAEK